MSKVIKSVLLSLKKVKFFSTSLLLVGKIGSFGVCCGSGRAVGQTPNVPMCGWLKLFFKMCGGKNF
ncbi:MAG: hypothetical protein F9K09_04770 [Flavobacteriales bacterium]|nr:MAG: hypothetical protein F9K09_04770 [Flavobacteriales bacterium]